jgi:hypothetical protein
MPRVLKKVKNEKTNTKAKEDSQGIKALQQDYGF